MGGVYVVFCLVIEDKRDKVTVQIKHDLEKYGKVQHQADKMASFQTDNLKEILRIN